MQTATPETESKSRDLSICVHHYTLRARCWAVGCGRHGTRPAPGRSWGPMGGGGGAIAPRRAPCGACGCPWQGVGAPRAPCRACGRGGGGATARGPPPGPPVRRQEGVGAPPRRAARRAAPVGAPGRGWGRHPRRAALLGGWVRAPRHAARPRALLGAHGGGGGATAPRRAPCSACECPWQGLGAPPARRRAAGRVGAGATARGPPQGAPECRWGGVGAPPRRAARRAAPVGAPGRGWGRHPRRAALLGGWVRAPRHAARPRRQSDPCRICATQTRQVQRGVPLNGPSYIAALRVAGPSGIAVSPRPESDSWPPLLSGPSFMARPGSQGVRARPTGTPLHGACTGHCWLPWWRVLLRFIA